MKTRIQSYLSYLIMAVSFCIQAQAIKEIVPKIENYGIDKEHKIIVWNIAISKLQKTHQGELRVAFDSEFTFDIKVDELSYEQKYDIKINNQLFKLYITELPIIKIEPHSLIKDNSKIIADFTYANNNSLRKNKAGIEHRGNISLKFPKKSYDIEFWENPDEQISIDVEFGDLRDDDDWILDGLYNEPLRLRSYLCNKLWLSIHKPSYLSQNKDAKSGIDLMFTEVFLDTKYIGIYALTEQVDRKLLKLKKYKKGKVRGELFKAGSYEGAPSYKKAPKYRNIFPHWAGYEIKYPYINYNAQWKNIHRFTKFVIKSKDSVFKKKIASKFDLDNAIDYFLFINLIRATDNLGKNFYVARYDKKTPYFNVPWDLDGVLGTIQDGKRIPTTNDILSNGLFDKLLRVNPVKYRQRLKDRWLFLRKHQFSNEVLFQNLQESYDYFKNNKVYEREALVWSTDITLDDHLEYITSWLTDRLQYLDTHFKSL